MANLAIKGELTYEKGKELISILELLGGNNKYNHDGTKSSYWYYIDSEGIIHALIHSFVANDFIFLTLEEYLYRYPYIVGDKVIYHDCVAVVTAMEWINNEVCYTVLHKGIIWQTTVFYLQPYKEEIMEGDKAKALNLIGEDYSGKRFVYKIPNGYEFDCVKNNEIILKPKQLEYPKTYEKCCEILGVEEELWFVYEDIDGNHINPACISNYRIRRLDLYHNFEKLIICRDAYWKIAGEQMGMDKPWEPDWSSCEDKYCITIFKNKQTFDESQYISRILVFPTAEMRNAFKVNFDDDIEFCKEFL